MKRKILLIGKNGQVGWELHRTLSTIGDVIASDRGGIQLDQPESIRKAIREVQPDVIVNAAAYTAVDRAEEEQTLAMAVNGTAPGVIAEEAERVGALVVHYSTDYVFDGKATTPYTESSETSPLNWYGRSKLTGEQEVQKNCSHYLILRTSWVYGARGHNFLRTMLRLGREKEQLKIVNDQIGAPTWSRHIAQVTAHLIPAYQPSSNLAGIYHCTSAGQTSWFDFATHIFDFLDDKQPANYRRPTLVPIPSSEYPLPAERPKYAVLSNKKLYDHFEIQIPDWTQGLKFCLGEYIL